MEIRYDRITVERIACRYDPELTKELAAATAKEASAAGLHVTFSPMCDLSRDARWGRCMEGTGEDPWLNARMAEAMVLGYQGDGIDKEGNIAACVKHFAAYGAATAGRDYSGVELCERTLLEDYLPSYEAAVKAGPCRELKGLKKLLIRAGESVTVSFDITEDMLRFYNEDMEYVAEPGEFKLWIGGASTTENVAGFVLK